MCSATSTEVAFRILFGQVREGAVAAPQIHPVILCLAHPVDAQALEVAIGRHRLLDFTTVAVT